MANIEHINVPLEKETHVPAVVVNQDGTIVAVNAAFEAVFGWSRQEIVGRTFDAEHTITVQQQHGQWIFAATVRPVKAPTAQ